MCGFTCEEARKHILVGMLHIWEMVSEFPQPRAVLPNILLGCDSKNDDDDYYTYKYMIPAN